VQAIAVVTTRARSAYTNNMNMSKTAAAGDFGGVINNADSWAGLGNDIGMGVVHKGAAGGSERFRLDQSEI